MVTLLSPLSRMLQLLLKPWPVHQLTIALSDLITLLPVPTAARVVAEVADEVAVVDLTAADVEVDEVADE